MTSIMRRRLLVVAAGVVLVALLVVMVQGVFAAVITFHQAFDGTANVPTATVNPPSTNDGSAWGWPNIPVGTGGKYRVMSNYWNPAARGANEETGSMDMQVDDQTGAWSVTGWDADSYFSSPKQASCTPGSDPEDLTCSWAGHGAPYDPALENTANHQIHAPSAYPAIYMGCHWNQCTAANGAPFPMPLSAVASLRSTWNFTVPTNGVYDAAYDIWLDKTGQIASQPNGAEIMIWLNNNGYDGTDAGNPIRPAGMKVASGVEIMDAAGNSLGTYDIWTARSKSFNTSVSSAQRMWNVISYVRIDKVLSISDFDSRRFIDDVFTRGPGGTVLMCAPDPRAISDGYVTGDETATVPCIDRSWQLTSVQAGFEIWEGGTYADFKSNSFSVDPIVVSGPITGTRTLDDGTPVVHWAEKFKVEANSCQNGTEATFTITATEPDPDISTSGTLTESPTGSGYFVSGDVGPLQDLGMHGAATIKISMNCGGTQVDRTAVLYIDPSGVVVNTLGEPIEGAEVRLSRSTSSTAAGPFVDVSDGDTTIMDPDINTAIPTYTNKYGWYRWDVIAGWYKVRATKAGCTSDETPAVQVAEPPGVTNLNLVLNCGETPPSNVKVQVVKRDGDWGSGYCADVYVTNNGTQPEDWKVTFDIEGTIYDFWNAIWSQNGAQVTAEGNADWNNILQPGQTTHDIGFCANRTAGGITPTPNTSGVSVAVSTQSDWGTGYCANVVVTNNTSAPVDWKVTFDVVGTINNFWNAVWSQSGSTATAEGVDWNNVLQPGQSTNSIGFCAAK